MQWTLSKEPKRGVTSCDFLNATAHDLEARGTQLAWIDVGSDSFLIFVAPDGKRTLFSQPEARRAAPTSRSHAFSHRPCST